MIKVELLENFDRRIQASNPESKLMHKELITHINAAIDLLPDKCKIVFKLSRDEQLSHKEIAKKLNISTKTVEAHITIALKALKSSLSTIAGIELIVFVFHDMLF